jgi:hypothetical protein
MFQFGVLVFEETSFKLYQPMENNPSNGLDTALTNYRSLIYLFPKKIFKLVRIDYTVMEVLPE